jgi:hypothetical protein
MWMDNTAAAAFPPEGTGRGSVAGDSIQFVFHYTASTSFHTTFVYDRKNDSWQWHMTPNPPLPRTHAPRNFAGSNSSPQRNVVPLGSHRSRFVLTEISPWD